jgi:hypothetical protein
LSTGATVTAAAKPAEGGVALPVPCVGVEGGVVPWSTGLVGDWSGGVWFGVDPDGSGVEEEPAGGVFDEGTVGELAGVVPCAVSLGVACAAGAPLGEEESPPPPPPQAARSKKMETDKQREAFDIIFLHGKWLPVLLVL